MNIKKYIGLELFLKMRYKIIYSENIKNGYYNLIYYENPLPLLSLIRIETLHQIFEDHNMELIRNTSGKIIYILIIHKKKLLHKSIYI